MKVVELAIHGHYRVRYWLMGGAVDIIVIEGPPFHEEGLGTYRYHLATCEAGAGR